MGKTARLLIAVVPALAILLGLGTWQMQRLTWKSNLITLMDARLTMAPTPLPTESLDLEQWQFRPVHLTGHFIPDIAFVFPARKFEGHLGRDIIAPFVRTGDGSGDVVMVHRGWLPPNETAEIPGDIELNAVVRRPWEKTAFRPDNDITANQWFWMDLTAMAAQVPDAHVQPYYLAALPTDRNSQTTSTKCQYQEAASNP